LKNGSCPEFLLQLARLLFEHGADDFDVPLSRGEYCPAGEVEGRVFGMVAGRFL
jgi:hypothetical protein